MAITIKRYGEDISNSVSTDDMVMTQVLTKEVGRLEFKILNTPGKSTCSLGAVIEIIEDGTKIFGGTVTDKQAIIDGGILVGNLYIANDWSFRLNSKLVIQSYEAQDPQAIVDDIIANYTDGTFTTTGVVLGGFNVPSVKFNYQQVTVSLEKLANQIGWQWFVTPDKDVQFFPPTVVVSAPYDIDDTSGNLEWASLDIDKNIINMKNSVYVIGGTYTKTLDASTTPDQYLTDGTKSVFSLAYPYTPDSIVVTLAGVSQTIGTDQVTDPGSVQVLYNEGGRFIRFTSVPTTGQTVKVYGMAQIPILAHVQDNVAIAAYGEIQDAIIDQQIKSIDEAQQRGQALIEKYGAPVYAIKFATLRTGFRVGQTVRVNSTILGENVLVVIKRIVGKPYGANQFRYEIECVGTETVNFIDIMKMLLTQANDQTVVNDSTVLQVLQLLSETLTVTDTLIAPTSTSGPYKWGVDAAAKAWNFFTWG